MDASSDQPRRSFSIKLWPPSEKTRQMLLERMTNNLSNPTIFTRKYGSLTKEEASKGAKYIEEVAYTSANQNYVNEPDGDGSTAVQLYAKECSKLILDILKNGLKPELNEVIISPPVSTFFDISKRDRGFIEAQVAQEVLKPLQEPGNLYTKICFSNQSFGLGAAKVAEPILVSIKDQLKEVDLSDFVAGRPEEEALNVMNIFSAALEGSILKSLNLSDNALGEKGVRAFRKLLKSQTSLEELYLMNDGISEEAAKAVCELVTVTDKLKILQFHNNMTGDEGAIAIAQVVKGCPLLEDFRCSSTRVDSKGGITLSEALKTCSNLKKLDLRDNMFGTEAGLALSKSIITYENLNELYLSYLNLEDEGVISIANALKDSASKLTILEMAGNDLTAGSASALADCLRVKQSITKLNLSENELKDEGTIVISNAIQEGHEELQEVDFSLNKIRRAGARTLAQSVINKSGFKLLNLDGNFISDEGVNELMEMFKKSPDILGPLDDNDPEGEDDDDDDEDDEEKESGDEDEDELESKLKNLDVNQED